MTRHLLLMTSSMDQMSNDVLLQFCRRMLHNYPCFSRCDVDVNVPDYWWSKGFCTLIPDC